MASQRVNFLQRNTTGVPLTGATITTTSLYDDGSAGPVIGNAVELDAINQPGFYYFDVDVAATKRLTVVADAGSGVTGEYRYTPFVLDDIDPTARLIAGQVWNTLTASHVAAGSFGEAVGVTAPANVAAVAGDVWDEATASHVAAGTFGLALGTTIQASIAAIPDATDIENAVWDAQVINHQNSGTFGLFVFGLPFETTNVVWGIDSGSWGGVSPTPMGNVLTGTAEATWDVDLSFHTASGTTGEALNDISGSTPAGIASAVWGALVASNQVSGSFGEAVTIIQALQHRNWRLTGATYSGSPARLTAATLVLYPSKADAIAQTNAILTQAFTATYNANGEMTASLQTDL